MMNLSHDVQDILKTMRVIKENLDLSSNKSHRLPLDRTVATELIDIDNIDFDDDETWLYESPAKNSNIKDLKAWLYPDTLHLRDYKFHSNHLKLTRELTELDTKKMIDSRTFTRPKKRLLRPSIERYNDGYFRMGKFEPDPIIDENESNVTLKVNDSLDVTYCGNTDNEIPQQPPLQFDLSEPINTNIFEKIISTASDVDSFQNMSPPSLINSMCSSTFTNLMENSMIKNDPLLREISVADYTEAMLQDYDPPLFRSITDSCSSINLDNPDSFMKQNSEGTLNSIYKKSVMNNKELSLDETFIAGEKSDNSTLGDTYVKESSSDISSTDVCNDVSIIINCTKDTHLDNTGSNLNGTYRRGVHSKLNETFEKSPLSHSNDNLNSTVTYMNDSNRFTSPRRRSYIVDRHNDTLTRPVENKRNSVGHSVGSSDSLDYLSSLSSGSRDSNKMLNMAEVDAICLQQEQSLQAMSTPKPTSKIISKLWEHSNISPVATSDITHTSDSELSSNDEYKTVRSNISGSDSISSGKSNKSVENNIKAEPFKSSSKSLNGVKLVNNNKIINNKGSYSNLKTVGTTLKGSYGNLKPLGVHTYGSNKGSTTNLKTMNSNLKGSYTQLKPVLSNLPCTDTNMKAYNSDSRAIKRPNMTSNVDSNIKTVEVAPTLHGLASKVQAKPAPFSNNNAKPQLKASGLPRPVSSIPRPSVSKIPGPRSRPLTSRTLSRPVSKHNLDYDF